MIKRIFSRQKSISTTPAKQFHVDQNLAYTPAQMNALRNKGIPISNMMVSESLFDDGTLSGDMSYDPVLARGVNEIDAWNMEREAKKNLLRGHKSDVETFDD
ncbi:hypothetical protein [Peromfec virus RodF8_10]|uniref:Uncharacterized protein n=1 Tax=Peromfec virus RodF8_10 TaxID=2929357 RepID=A0A976N281_9VIRU|nr:hypothetical protein [Peromfec virus RodF8_10]